MTPNPAEVKMLETEYDLLTPIQKFYTGTTIFITGATGFMGKCLVNKILRSCPGVEKIYILIRQKKGKNATDRVEKLLTDIVFSTIKNGKLLSKVLPIAGDISLPDLGMSLEDRRILQNEVNIVFHVAATVNFNEKLKKSVAINVSGTQEILKLSKEMKNLKSVVHVSTAYSNCHLEEIDEKFYTYPMSYEEILNVMEKLDDPAIEIITPKILGKWPNTYVFTKAMAETIVQREKGDLPLVVFRPAIVTSSVKEPVPGWVDSFVGLNGLCAGAILGMFSSLWSCETMNANIVPVDWAINALIACAWNVEAKNTTDITKHLGSEIYMKNCDEKYECATNNNNNYNNNNGTENNSHETDSCIYNYVSNQKTISWGELIEMNLMFARRCPPKNAIWCLNFRVTSSYILHKYYVFMFNILPALIFDGLAFLVGKKPKLFKIHQQSSKLFEVVSYFITHDWKYTNKNVQKLWYTLDPKDQEIFPFNMGNINWTDYLRNYIPGTRKFLCREDESTIPDGIRKRDRFKLAQNCIIAVLCYFAVSFVLFMLRTMVNIIF